MRRTISLFFLLVFVAGILFGALVVSYMMNLMSTVENTGTLRIENLAGYTQSVKIVTGGTEYIIKIDKKENIQIKANFKENLQVYLISLDYDLGDRTEFKVLDVDFIEKKINRTNGEQKHIKVDFN